MFYYLKFIRMKKKRKNLFRLISSAENDKSISPFKFYVCFKAYMYRVDQQCCPGGKLIPNKFKLEFRIYGWH